MLILLAAGIGQNIQVASAAVSLMTAVCAAAWVAHRGANRIEESMREVRDNSRELLHNGGSSVKDAVTPGRGGMADSILATDRKVDVLVDALGTVRARVENSNDLLNDKIDRLSRDVTAASVALQLHTITSDMQRAALLTQLEEAGLKISLAPKDESS